MREEKERQIKKFSNKCNLRSATVHNTKRPDVSNEALPRQRHTDMYVRWYCLIMLYCLIRCGVCVWVVAAESQKRRGGKLLPTHTET